MKKLGMIVLLMFFSFTMTFANLTALFGNNEDMQSIVQSNDEFAFDLYSKLKRNGNSFFSPFSIFDALSMVYAGANGETKTQMTKTLHIRLSNDKFNVAFSKTVDLMNLTATNSSTLNVANALWVQKGFKLLPSFVSIIDKYYNGELYKVDFAKPLEAKKMINDWVREKTKGKIEDIINRLPGLTRLVLTNAIYFNGKWKVAFKASNTKKADFFVDSGHTTKVEMMYQKSKFSYMQNDLLQALRLPYGSGKLSMIVLLPKDKDGIQNLENSLSASNFKKWCSEMKEQTVKVFFPKFKLRDGYSLNSVLKSLGMKNAFDNADFSGIDGAKDLVISDVLHKAFVDVNEKGTEAAAVTSVIMTLTCAPNVKPPVIPVFKADHPFIFFIVDKISATSDLILFMGKVEKP